MKKQFLVMFAIVFVGILAATADADPPSGPTSDIVAWWAAPNSLTNTATSDSDATITYGELPTYPGFFGILIQGGADQSVELPGDYVVALTFDNEYSVIREAVAITDPVPTQSIIETDQATQRLLISDDGRPFRPLPLVEDNTLASSVTSTSTTFAPALTVALTADTYHCHVHGIVTESYASDGAQLRLNTSGITAGSASQTSGLLAQSASLPDVEATIGAGSTTWSNAVLTTGIIDADATLVVTVAGNVTLDLAQVAHTTGTTALVGGSSLRCSM